MKTAAPIIIPQFNKNLECKTLSDFQKIPQSKFSVLLTEVAKFIPTLFCEIQVLRTSTKFMKSYLRKKCSYHIYYYDSSWIEKNV